MSSESSERTKVLILHHQPELYLDMIERRFPDIDISLCRSYEELPKTLAQAEPDVVLAYKIGRVPFPRRELFSTPSVRWVHAGGAGVDHLVPWDKGRVTVTNSSGVHVDVIAQYVTCAILMFSLHFPQYARQQNSRHWQAYPLPGARGKTLVVVGYGRIGREVGARAKALGMTVIGVDMEADSSAAADEVLAIDSLLEALPRADFVALHLPLTEHTRNLFGADAITAMKFGAVLINVSRGGIVDEAALIEALESDAIAGAVIDVFATEPLPADSPFWDLPNVIVTPHTGDPSDWQARVAEVFCDNLERWRQGEELTNIVLPERGY